MNKKEFFEGICNSKNAYIHMQADISLSKTDEVAASVVKYISELGYTDIGNIIAILNNAIFWVYFAESVGLNDTSSPEEKEE